MSEWKPEIQFDFQSITNALERIAASLESIDRFLKVIEHAEYSEKETKNKR